MKAYLAAILILSVILKVNWQLAPCNLETIKQDIPPRIFFEQTIDGSSQSTFVTRFFHNKLGIFASEAAGCYFRIIDPNFILSIVGVFGLFFWIYFIYAFVIRKYWFLGSAFLGLPALYLLNFSSDLIVFFEKIFVIIGLLILYPKLKVKQYLLVAIIVLAAFLRLYKLASVPPSLYWDEASLGYNAYSILKTAHDEHGRFLPITNFSAFGDYKPPGYIYATVPSIALFGVNEFGIRFPSAFFGILTVILTYFLVKKLTDNDWIALLSSFFLAISPWHLQFSRGAFEANLGLFFSTCGIYFFLKFKEKPLFIFLSFLSFILGMYTFTGQRLFVPFILVVLILVFFSEVIKNIKIVAMAGIISIILFWPLFKFATQTQEGRLRFEEVTIFKNLEPINQSIKYRSLDKFSWWSDLIHNRRLFFVNDYLVHYFDAFNPSFLFSKGDVNPRLSIQEVGELYLFDLVLVLSGIYFIFAKNYKYRFLLLGWLLVSPLGPATARETPHALRMIHILPTFQILAGFGFYYLYKTISRKKVFLISGFTVIAVSLLYCLHMYYLHYPKEYSGQWQYGYRQAVDVVKSNYNAANSIVVTKSAGRPYIYFLLYMKYDPKNFWETAQLVRDKFFFLDIDGFGKFKFTDSLSEAKVSGKVLYVTFPDGLPPGSKRISRINDLSGTPVFDIGWKE